MKHNNAETIKRIREYADQLPQKVYEAMEYSMLSLMEPLKREAPVDNGLLRASITYDININEKNQVVARVGIMSGQASDSGVTVGQYALWVHQGTGIYAEEGNGRKTPWRYYVEDGKYKGWHLTQGQKANPFLRRGVNNNKANINTWFKEGFHL